MHPPSIASAPARRLLALCLLGALLAACGGTGTSCIDSRDCAPGQACFDGVCRAVAAPDASVDAGTPDGDVQRRDGDVDADAPDDAGPREELLVVVYASAHDGPSAPENTLDGDLGPSSRWSAPNEAWIRYDLSRPVTVDRAGI